jgi:glycerol-3-phosphate dehydrogenase (NAD(P)+)
MKGGVSIVGGGVWGRALAQVFANNSEVLLYSLPIAPVEVSNPKIQVSYERESLRGTKHLFLVVPCAAVRDVCKDIAGIIDGDCKIIICAKGIEPATGLLMSEVVGEFFPKASISVLSGPNFASEILNGLPAITSIVSDDISLSNSLAEKFTTENFKLLPSSNVIMAQLFAAIKNVLAILCGAARGLELGENFAAAIVSAGVKEIMQLAAYKDARNGSLILEPAGIGDLFLTCSSTTSRNNKFGLDLVTKYIGKNYQEIFALEPVTIEGVSTILALKNWGIELSLMSFAYEAITAKYKDKKAVIHKLQNVVLKNHE